MDRSAAFPLGARATLEELAGDPHALLARLREREPVSWLPALGGWLVSRHDLALAVMRDAQTFTVDDVRFSTAQVIGTSMLSLDGPEHDRQRAPFVAPFRAAQVHERFESVVTEEVEHLIDGFAEANQAELRGAFAGPLAAAVVARALGLDAGEVGSLLAWYGAIVKAVTDITAGRPRPQAGARAFAALRDRLAAATAAGGGSLLHDAAGAGKLSADQVASNAAVLLFGGIETTEAMIANALLMLLERPELQARARGDRALLAATVEESLRLEPAAAVVDRYATADTSLAGASIRRGDLVRVSIAAANRDPAVFDEPDRFDAGRHGVRAHLAFAHGPHVCVGLHLARLEARIALARMLARLPRLRLDSTQPATITGLVFRKPETLYVGWR